MSKFYEISDPTRDSFFKVFTAKSFPISVKFQFIGVEKQKQFVKIMKMPDQYSFLMEKDLLVCFNEDLAKAFDEESMSILIEQEIDKITVDIDSGKIKMIKPDLSTFSSLIKKYGVDKVARANQISDLYHQQVKDGKEEFIA